MEWYTFLGFFIVALLGLLVLKVPVAWAMLGVGMVGAVVAFGEFGAATHMVGLSVIQAVNSFVFTAIPLFMLMGEILFRSQVAQEALDEISKVLGRLPGRLAMVSVGGGAMFGLLSGSTLANTALFGSTLLPEMRKRGYSEKLAVGSILAAGGLAMILPPSALAILWGAVARVPIGPLLIAGVIPGLIMAIGYTVIVLVWVKRFGGAPAEELPPPRALGEVLRSGFRRAFAPGLLIAVVLGLIFFGLATPTESAAVGVVAAALIALAQRRLNARILFAAAKGTVRTTAMIFFILVGSNLFGQLMSFTGATGGIVGALTGGIANQWLMLLIIMALLLVLGIFIDQASIMLVTAPLLMPIAAAMGWNPIWFSILVLINLQIANTTPPFGMSLFVMRGVAPDIPTTTLYRSVLPWMTSDVIVIVLVAVFPVLALWLPGFMG